MGELPGIKVKCSKLETRELLVLSSVSQLPWVHLPSESPGREAMDVHRGTVASPQPLTCSRQVLEDPPSCFELICLPLPLSPCSSCQSTVIFLVLEICQENSFVPDHQLSWLACPSWCWSRAQCPPDTQQGAGVGVALSVPCAFTGDLHDSIIQKAFWVERLLLIGKQEVQHEKNVENPQGYPVPCLLEPRACKLADPAASSLESLPKQHFEPFAY